MRLPVAATTLLFISSCATPVPPAEDAGNAEQTVASTLTRATTADGKYISWREHLIDTESVNGGVEIRGGDGLAMADLDGDGFQDVVSVHEDSAHIRIAFGSASPVEWTLMTLAQGDDAKAVEDVAIGDLNNDGRLDIIAACEDGHLIYFENPGEAAKKGPWPSIIPSITRGRGSWLRVFMADMNGDGQLDITAANKGSADIVTDEQAAKTASTTSLFVLDGPPLEQSSWREQVLLRSGIANTARPIDFDGDGDFDVLAASRQDQTLFVLENAGTSADGTVQINTHDVAIDVPSDGDQELTAQTNAFMDDTTDLDGDGLVDLVLSAQLTPADGGQPWLGLVWLRQPASFDEAWTLTKIGDTLPDWIAGLRLADIDSDGDLDVITGGYSGLNILVGAYSGAARDHDDPSVTASDSTGRIAWFENPGNASGDWTRHDISRRVRGMFDGFIAQDLDGDGDLDMVATRGNSGSHDGVFWLEQVRTDDPQRNFQPANPNESRALPLPPENWIESYSGGETYAPPPNTE
ncbi:VCBS repeat-containing protein [Henriciella sp. AS95]|uniref:FG-GAP repeat domain-containing protein n=1 Tax=Henriciella sp. AS95 TaxID=3135782 RepID=UPI00318044B1